MGLLSGTWQFRVSDLLCVKTSARALAAGQSAHLTLALK